MNRRVLLVDDDALVRMLVSVLLEAEGWQVEAAGSLAEARAALGGGPPPRVLVLDAQLPDGNGLSLLDAMECGGGTHVVLHSGHDDGEVPAGVDAVVSKLGAPGELADHLATL